MVSEEVMKKKKQNNDFKGEWKTYKQLDSGEIVKAIRFTDKYKDRVYQELRSIHGNVCHDWNDDKKPCLKIPDKDGGPVMILDLGDYVVQEADFKLYVCLAEVFHLFYHPISDVDEKPKKPNVSPKDNELKSTAVKREDGNYSIQLPRFYKTKTKTSNIYYHFDIAGEDKIHVGSYSDYESDITGTHHTFAYKEHDLKTFLSIFGGLLVGKVDPKTPTVEITMEEYFERVRDNLPKIMQIANGYFSEINED